MIQQNTRVPFFVREDLDGFFGLFVDNLVQLLLIAALCSGLCGMRGDDAFLLYGYVMPGAAVSVIIGNIFYAWQARRLARATGRTDVTALPYGINTPSLLVYIFFVMAPVYQQTGSARAAWQMGVIACLGSGVIEFAGAFVAGWVRKRTPRAALLSSLSGIAIGFISMTFMLQMWQRPLVALPPLAILLVNYLGRIRFRGMPGGLAAILAGTALAWLLPQALTGLDLNMATVAAQLRGLAIEWPSFAGISVFTAAEQHVSEWSSYLSVMIPMGLFNVLGSLQNIESAEAAGDAYDARSSLAMNGAASLLAACCGSCFPTTIYIGHPGWKAMGARTGYSLLNALAVALICFTGAVMLAAQVVPLEACVAIVLWIGIIITAQAFVATPAKHAAAVALGLFPAIAAWGATLVNGTFIVAASAPGALTMQELLSRDLFAQTSGFLIHSLNLLQQGYIFTCMILAAVTVALIDRRFYSAAAWSALAALLTFSGLMHAYQLAGNSVLFNLRGSPVSPGALVFSADTLTGGYCAVAAIFAVIGYRLRNVPASQNIDEKEVLQLGH